MTLTEIEGTLASVAGEVLKPDERRIPSSALEALSGRISPGEEITFVNQRPRRSLARDSM